MSIDFNPTTMTISLNLVPADESRQHTVLSAMAMLLTAYVRYV